MLNANTVHYQRYSITVVLYYRYHLSFSALPHTQHQWMYVLGKLVLTLYYCMTVRQLQGYTALPPGGNTVENSRTTMCCTSFCYHYPALEAF